MFARREGSAFGCACGTELNVDRRIPSLDGLRALSILMVLYGHTVGTKGFPIRHASLGLAESGVRIFFIISGFLITQLLLNEQKSTGGISLKGFYRRRILRIFPAFYSYWLAMLLLTVTGVLAIPARDLAYAATYTINYVVNRSWYLGHLWSLAVEEQFYALWPLSIILVGWRRAFQGAAALLLLVPLIRVAQARLIPSHQLGITEEFHTIADCIATGCLLAGLRGWLWTHDRYRQWISSWRFWLAPALTGLALVLYVHPEVKWLIGIPLFNLSVAVCIDRWTRFPDADWVGKLLNWKPLTLVGVLSYSLYLWQQPFFDHQSHHLWNRFPANVLGAFLLASISYFAIEKPFLGLRYKRPANSGLGPAPGKPEPGAPEAV